MPSCSIYVNCKGDSVSWGGERAASDLVELVSSIMPFAWMFFSAVLADTFLGPALGFNVNVTEAILCASLGLYVLFLSGAFIDRVRRAYIDALPPDNRVLATVPDECGAAAKRLSTIVAPVAVVCMALIRCRFDREEMPPASV